MDDELSPEHERILGALAARGTASSQELQELLGKSQASVSRLLSDLRHHVVSLGRARAARYGLSKSIHGSSSQQAIFWTHEDGQQERLGTLTLLEQGRIHIDAGPIDLLVRGTLPWFLTPLRAQGFLGRLLARRLAAQGVATDPDAWPLETQLFAALSLHDGAGAITLGEAFESQPTLELPSAASGSTAMLDTIAADVASTLPAGSSAAGEQPKFLARRADGTHLLIKFSPPHGTPFGDRWHDLLHAESLASATLQAHGVEVARSSVIETKRHTFLCSERFDRVGARGRRHVVAIGAAHAGLAPGPYVNWAASAEALAGARRLTREDAARARALRQFGHLIGNTDMHAGNLGLLVPPGHLAKGLLRLAPVYDMLPMRWRPDAVLGGAPEYQAFEPEAWAVGSGASGPARDFWDALSRRSSVSPAMRKLAARMVDQV